jgi:hypothetical protein
MIRGRNHHLNGGPIVLGTRVGCYDEIGAESPLAYDDGNQGVWVSPVMTGVLDKRERLPRGN